MHLESLRDFCLSLPGCTEDFPFDDNILAFRVSSKIFVLTDVDEGHSFNVKCDPERAIELREHYPDTILPGYHMNKKHWNTVLLQADLDEKLLRELIQHSYERIRNSLPKAQKLALDEAYGAL